MARTPLLFPVYPCSEHDALRAHIIGRAASIEEAARIMRVPVHMISQVELEYGTVTLNNSFAKADLVRRYNLRLNEIQWRKDTCHSLVLIAQAFVCCVPLEES